MLCAQGWGEGSSTKSIAKKIQKHAKSQAHIAAGKILAEQKERKIETASLKSVDHSRELTQKCLRTTYFVGYHNRPFTDYPELVTLQSTNGIKLGSILHSRFSFTLMIECILDAFENAFRLRSTAFQFTFHFYWNAFL